MKSKLIPKELLIVLPVRFQILSETTGKSKRTSLIRLTKSSYYSGSHICCSSNYRITSKLLNNE